MSDKPTTPPPAYFLSLSLENVRSFGEKQTIYFTEGGKPDGRPAQWTIILGDNGVGKTTVLKALAALMPVVDTSYDKELTTPVFNMSWQRKWWPTRHNGELTAHLSIRSTSGWSFTEPKASYFSPSPISIDIAGKDTEDYNDYVVRMFDYHKNDGELLCYGYGASRSTGNSTLSRPFII